jgi:hypothetical protein
MKKSQRSRHIVNRAKTSDSRGRVEELKQLRLNADTKAAGLTAISDACTEILETKSREPLSDDAIARLFNKFLSHP